MGQPLTRARAKVDVLVLAGDRGRDDPLVQGTGAIGKALVPVAGVPMLTRVLSAVAAWGGTGRLVVVAPDAPAYRAAAAAALQARGMEAIWVAPAASLVESVEQGLASLDSELRVLLTADHALLRPVWLDTLLAAASQRPASVSVGLADWQLVMQRFPGSRRTRYRFRDCSVCGTNLFVLGNDPGVGRILQTWREVESERKKPWRIVSLLGWSNLGRYLTGRLTLEDAFGALSARVDAVVRAIPMSDPLTAVDVDSLADLCLVEEVICAEERASC